MAHRIHFTVADLARTRVDTTPRPMSELLNALHTLRQPTQSVRFGAWRRQVFDGLPGRAGMIFDLVPVYGWSPSFLTPRVTESPEAALETVRSAAPSAVRGDLAEIAENQPLPPWTHQLGRDRRLWRHLCDTYDLVYDQVLAPWWPHVCTEIAADRLLRERVLCSGGVEALFASLSPRFVQWKAPVLEIRTSCDADLYLEGRGLLLVPSPFAITPMVCCDDRQPQPVVTYPIGARSLGPLTTVPPTTPPGRAPAGSLATLIGSTRAAVLHTIAEYPGCTTKELAARAGVAPSTASEHATVLREAGLCHTHRHRNTALHSPTPLGIALVNRPASAVPPAVLGEAVAAARG